MSRLFDFMDWLLSFALLAGAVLTIWVAAVLIGEQNHVTGVDEDIEQDWLSLKEGLRYNWEHLKDRWRR